MQQQNEAVLRIGEVAAACGVSVDTIRHYERVGVLRDVERSGNGYRLYTAASVDRVRLVRRALLLGFTLEELSRILRQRDSGLAPCRQVRALAARKLADLDDRIAELLSLRDTLSHTVDSWDALLAGTAEGQPAHLLESLAERKK